MGTTVIAFWKTYVQNRLYLLDALPHRSWPETMQGCTLSMSLPLSRVSVGIRACFCFLQVLHTPVFCHYHFVNSLFFVFLCSYSFNPWLIHHFSLDLSDPWMRHHIVDGSSLSPCTCLLPLISASHLVRCRACACTGYLLSDFHILVSLLPYRFVATHT